MRVGIIGYGWVGKATHRLFPDAMIYDPYLQVLPYRSREEFRLNDVSFVCVPTPLLSSGKLDSSIVEESIAWCTSEIIVVRSTVNPGDIDTWKQKYRKRIVFQPEYLGETPNHPNLDMGQRKFMILGGDFQDTRKVIDLYTSVYNANVSIRQVTALEAEIIKLTENRAIGFKVMQCHELFLACEKANVDYYTVRDAVFGDDPRQNLWFTFIYPGKLGFDSSKCLVKDIPAWCAWAESMGADASITRTLVEKSKEWANAGKV